MAAPGMWEFDIRPPSLRSGILYRDDLVERLVDTDAHVVTITAPGGYGKTTLLAQWAKVTKDDLAWLNVQPGDNDVTTFSLRLKASFARAGVDMPGLGSWARPTDASTPPSTPEGHLPMAVRPITSPITLVLDNAHTLKARPSVEVVAEMVRQLEGRVRFVISSRSRPRLPLAAMRVRGALMELNEVDLAMTGNAVSRLLIALGRGSTPGADLLARGTGGWPAAIMLILAANPGEISETWIEPGADLHLLSEYVREEILPQLSRQQRDFLKLLSPLNQISGALSVAVTEFPKAGNRLRGLVDAHLVGPVEDSTTWYQMNPVLRGVLRADLERDDPETADAVHSRAATWFRAHDMPLEAIEHAQRAGDVEASAQLMGLLIKDRFASGHLSEVLVWLRWLESKMAMEAHPMLTATGALVHALEGNALESERWLDLASRAPLEAPAASLISLVKALAMRSGVDQMCEDSEHALRMAHPGSPWTPAILLAKGLAQIIRGEAALAEPLVAEAADLGLRNGSLAAATLANAERAHLAIERQDWDLAVSASSAAMANVDEYGLDGYFTSGLALVMAARCARQTNDIEGARRLLARASLVRPRLNIAIPGVSVQTLLEMAKAHLEMSDVVGARTLVRDADEIVIQRPDLGVLPAALDTLKQSLAGLGPGTVGLSALTKAELRLLPFLATNLSFPEIGEQLFISRHTVKSQAMSIYRKLGTSTRSDAVAKAQDVGLLKR